MREYSIHKLIIGAPFGNYLHFPYATSTIGTFTAEYRGGFWKRVWAVLSTVRYYRGIQAWKNRLALPNPGIDWLSGKYFPHKIISIMGFDNKQWLRCVKAGLACFPLALELNISCPNCKEDKTNYKTVFRDIKEMAGQTELIVKLPPVNYDDRLEESLFAGISNYHCCNALPIPGGGLSGKPLKLLSLSCIKHVKSMFKKHNVPIGRLIGGGGITHIEDAYDYLKAGCNAVSVATVLINPFNHCRIKRIAVDISNQGD